MAESTVYQRLKIIQKHTGLNSSKFSKSIGMDPGNYGKIERGEAEPNFGFNTISLVCKTHGINANWLLFEEGEMLLSTMPISNDEDELAAQAAKIAELYASVSYWKKKCAELEAKLIAQQKGKTPK